MSSAYVRLAMSNFCLFDRLSPYLVGDHSRYIDLGLSWLVLLCFILGVPIYLRLFFIGEVDLFCQLLYDFSCRSRVSDQVGYDVGVDVLGDHHRLFDHGLFFPFNFVYFLQFPCHHGGP